MDAQGSTDSRIPALRLDKVVRSYGPVKAVNDVSLMAWPGEFIALLGPNGAGKSTLFQLLSGLFTPDSGRIEVMGQDMLRNAVPALAGLGIVFQQSTLDGELTVMANLLFHTGLHGMPKALLVCEVKAVGFELVSITELEPGYLAIFKPGEKVDPASVKACRT